ncbi:HNH endonuclease [Saccharothrix yanglingensis]|uniref:HNH endonuclease n=1 Tax=Saccharothrix yanglingensis TaxID=659496 RepID=A0ABU0X6Q5_9PSEU|nr:HNH endonuclease [Saccharothrix yanglingensis]
MGACRHAGGEAVDDAGDPLPALHQPHRPTTPTPAPRDRGGAGELSDGHLTELARAIALRLPEGSEEILVEAARSAEPKAVRQLADRIRDRAEQDRVDEVDEPAATPGDTLHLRDLPGGRLEFFGELSAETGARFTALLEPLPTPHPDGPRDAARRRGEAFADLIALASRSGDLPTEAGERPHISVTIDHDTLRRGVGHAVLDSDHHLSAAQARRTACDATVLPVVLGGDSEVLDPGRAKRTVSTAQRRALHARDRACAFPDCHRPPQWCDAHHIQHRADGGTTDLDNLALPCHTHHTLIHHTHRRITTTGGTPTFIPPRHTHPAQRHARTCSTDHPHRPSPPWPRDGHSLTTTAAGAVPSWKACRTPPSASQSNDHDGVDSGNTGVTSTARPRRCGTGRATSGDASGRRHRVR